MSTLLRLAALFCGVLLGAGVAPDPAAGSEKDDDPWVPVGFVIVRSTADYSEARQIAEAAAIRLGVPLDFRGLQLDSKLGLSFSPEACRAEALAPHPCYVARGREGASSFVSIERSDAYATFKPGVFIVVVGTGAPDSPELDSILASARAVYPDAYLKREKVYLGCMH